MDAAAPPKAPVLNAPAHWQTIDFISDLHLQRSQPATFKAWQHYLAHTPANALFILGDLFEVWVGDDVLDAPESAGFEAQCQRLLAAASARLDVFFMHGNRDFLLGEQFAKGARMGLLSDPSVLVFDQQRWLLSHGDALCLDDTDYQQFRRDVRSDGWRQRFLVRPLSERLALARNLRDQSEARKHSGAFYADVDETMAQDWLSAAQAGTLIHGHTHRPADHELKALSCDAVTPLRRRVLSDWDAQAHPPRLQVLRLQAGADPARIDLSTTGSV